MGNSISTMLLLCKLKKTKQQQERDVLANHVQVSDYVAQFPSRHRLRGETCGDSWFAAGVGIAVPVEIALTLLHHTELINGFNSNTPLN